MKVHSFANTTITPPVSYHGEFIYGVLQWTTHCGREIDLWKLIFQIADPSSADAVFLMQVIIYQLSG